MSGPLPGATGAPVRCATSLLNLCLFVLLHGGCNSERHAYRAAALRHGHSIAHIAAFAPYLRPPAIGTSEAIWRYGARAARLEIMRQAAAAQEHRALPGEASSPTSRVAQAMGLLLERCAFGPGEDAREERLRTGGCYQGVQQVNMALGREDARAVQLGLPQGTIPLITPAAINEEARRAAEALGQQLQLPAAEGERRRLWPDPEVAPALLVRICEEAQAQARAAVPGLAEEIAGACTPLREGERLIYESAACTGQGCSGLSLCGMLENLAQSAALPPHYQARLREAAARCRERHAPPVAE